MTAARCQGRPLGGKSHADSPQQRASRACELRVLHCMGDCGATFDEIRTLTGLSRGNAWHALHRLMRKGAVVHAHRGWWQIRHVALPSR